METLSIFLNLLGGLGLFLYGLRVMSESLQKVAGTRLRALLASATGNRFSATLTGFLVTCAVQSSSATTVMVVGFASAGLVTLTQSLGIIFGANIGTTTTAWIVSLLGFQVKITAFAVPLIGIGFFSQFIRRWKLPHRLGEVLVGFGLLFLGLALIKSGIPDAHSSPFVQEWLTAFSPASLGPRIALVAVGAVLTMIFQSSSAVMAVTLAAAANGLIDYPTAAALVLGENVGTTITANLAAIGAPLTARQAARGHFLFNIFGVLWAVLLFNPFARFVDVLLPGDPWGIGENVRLVTIPLHIAAFHTVFNVINTSVMLPLIRPLERVVRAIVPERASDKTDRALEYLSTPLMETPELAIIAAKKEVDRMAAIVCRMLAKIQASLSAKSAGLSEAVESVLEDERTTDFLEHQINEFLANLTHAHLSTASNKEVISLLSMINDLERMGDHGEKLAKLMRRRSERELHFTVDAEQELEIIAAKAIEIVEAMRAGIMKPVHDPMPAAREREAQLNALRSKFRQSHINRLASGKCESTAGIIFSDMLTSFEKLGDHAFNVVEAIVGIK